jgi:hypothetical protein
MMSASLCVDNFLCKLVNILSKAYVFSTIFKLKKSGLTPLFLGYFFLVYDYEKVNPFVNVDAPTLLVITTSVRPAA